MGNKYLKSFLFFGVSLIGSLAFSYPDFIGYGYRSCMTCHFNGMGGGPLNDYGRALFANTISSRMFVPDEVDDEKLSEKSGFFGSPSETWWLRPGAKFRGLFIVTNPGSPSFVNRLIPMQADINTAVFFDKKQKFGFVGTIGYLPRPQRIANSKEDFKEFVSREHYLRAKATEDIWVYFGLMDKAFGLRTSDHPTFARSKVGIGANDQTHGIMIHQVGETSDLVVHAFAGNLAQDADLRQAGASVFYEQEIGEKRAVGTSLMVSKNKYVGWNRASIHYKHGFGEGTSFIAEAGVLENKPLQLDQDKKFGSFLLTQSLFRVWRGYNLFMQFEHYNEEFKETSPDLYRLGFGMIVFPHYRYELRGMFQNQRGVSQLDFLEDSWNFQGQLHVAW